MRRVFLFYTCVFMHTMVKKERPKSMKKRTHQKRKPKERSIWQSVGIGIAAAVCSAALLLLICTKIALGQSDPSKWLLPCAVLCGMLSAAFAGALATRLDGRTNLSTSWLVGVGFSVIVAILSFILPSEGQNIWRWVFYAALTFCSFLGGLIGRKKPKKRHHRG